MCIRDRLAAFEALHARHPNTYHLVIVGDGPLRRVLPATRHRTDALTWRSYIQDNAKLAAYYHAADLFIHPGVCETFGLVVLEAQACGLPCVGVRGSFMDANIMVGLDHWATKNDPGEIADAIERYEDKDLAAMGVEASKRVHARFSWDKVFARQWALYTRARLHGAEASRRVHARFSWNKVFTRQWALYTRARLHGAEALHSIEPHPFSPEWVRG